MGGHQAEAEAADAWLQPGGLLEQLPTPLEERIHVLAVSRGRVRGRRRREVACGRAATHLR